MKEERDPLVSARDPSRWRGAVGEEWAAFLHPGDAFSHHCDRVLVFINSSLILVVTY
jgi:hypothetical protein